jgi:hypothetical protein
LLTALSILQFLPLSAIAQRIGQVDTTFNYGMPTNFKFDRGVLASAYNHDLIALPSGNLIVPAIPPVGAHEPVSSNFLTINKVSQSGLVDLNFNVYLNPIGDINYLKYANNKIIVLGALFHPITKIRTKNLIFDTSGVLNSFNSFSLPDSLSDIKAVFPHTNGKYLAISRVRRGGNWLSVLYRINPNGELDNTFSMFTPNLRYEIENPLTVALPDGNIILSTAGTDTSHQAIVKLNSNGVKDLTFRTPFQGYRIRINTMQLLPTGNILLSGRMDGPLNNDYKQLSVINSNGLIVSGFNSTFVNDFIIRNHYSDGNYIYTIGSSGFGQRLRAFRFFNSGMLDTSYKSDMAYFYFNYNSSVFLPSKGWIVNAATYSNSYINIDFNGKLNSKFSTYSGANGTVYGLKHLKSGKILLYGGFNQYGNTNASNIVRVFANGLRDTTFKSNLNFEGYINDVIEMDNNSIYIKGNFKLINGKPFLDVARLFEDGTLDTNFYFRENIDFTYINVYAKYFNVKANGSVVVNYVGDATAQNYSGLRRFNSNGTIDSSLMVQAVDATVYQLPSGKFIIGNGIYRINNVDYYGLNLHSENGSHIGQLYNTSGGINTITQIELHNDSLLYFSGTDRITRTRIKPVIGMLLIQPNINSLTGYRVVERALSIFSDSNSTQIKSFELQPNNTVVYHKYQSFPGPSIGFLNPNLQITQNTEIPINNNIVNFKVSPNGSLFLLGYIINYQNKIGQGLLKLFTEEVCNSSPAPSISGSNQICIGEPVILQSSAITGNIWNTGDTTSTITVSRPGSYYVRQRGQNCISENSPIFNVNTPRSLNRPTLKVLRLNGGGITIFKVQILNFDSTVTYQWSNGNTGSFVLVSSLENLSVRGNSNGCLSETSFPLTPLSSEISFSDNLLELYPNPAKNLINVKFPSAVRYRILNTLGQTISEGLLNQENTQIDIQGFKSGYYIFQTIEGNVVQKSFVKQ